MGAHTYSLCVWRTEPQTGSCQSQNVPAWAINTERLHAQSNSYDLVVLYKPYNIKRMSIGFHVQMNETLIKIAVLLNI